MMRVVIFVDGNSESVWCVGFLSDSIDNKCVIFFAVVGCDNLETVADVKEGGEVILVCRGVLLG